MDQPSSTCRDVSGTEDSLGTKGSSLTQASNCGLATPFVGSSERAGSSEQRLSLFAG